MALLRSGFVYFVSVTLVAATILSVFFFARSWSEGWFPSLMHPWWFAQSAAVVTGPTALLLMLFARLGRRQLALDGTILIAAIGFAVCAAIYTSTTASEDAISRSYAGMAWAFYLAGLATIIPAHLIICFTLRRTSLLRCLAPGDDDLASWVDRVGP